MDAAAILQAIGSLGFPIAMCLLLWQYNTKTMDGVRKALENNTNALHQLVLLVGKVEVPDNDESK